MSLDDFGTGFSSLTRLRDLPLTEVKIDESFVGRILSSPVDRTIVRSTIEMCRTLGLDVIAEGVEDEATARALVDMGCRSGQGFLFAKPARADELARRGYFELPDGSRGDAVTEEPGH